MSEYDSRIDTYQHIHLVGCNIHTMIAELLRRIEEHDQSKLVEPELSAFNDIVPNNLAIAEYGTEQYYSALRAQKEAIEHHYALNPHHPEHYEAGIAGMNLIDLLEMICDWQSAAQRKGNKARDSMDHNQTRFGFSDELKAILLNTLPLIE
jgi:hypothetical protein